MRENTNPGTTHGNAQRSDPGDTYRMNLGALVAAVLAFAFAAAAFVAESLGGR